MNYKSIFNLCLLTVFLILVPVGCDDWTELEIHDSQVNGFKEQNPEQYAAYTRNLRAYKATNHILVYARLDNAPETSSSEKDFLRALPDSIDMVTLRNAARLSDYDREDMKLVRTDYGTRVLYEVSATADEASLTAAVSAVRSGEFDGITVTAQSAVSEAAMNLLDNALGQTDCLMVFEGKVAFVPETSRDIFDYFISEIPAEADEFDVESILMYNAGFGIGSRLLLAVEPGYTLTDKMQKTYSAMGWVAGYLADYASPIGGIAVHSISADYYNTEIIYKQTRGVIQILNPALGN
ncbi:glycoside hydrolase family 18 [uncultured Bacteroides sp.]|uniref:glycoside hydrolase family 18 n=1 Tax=uncultured Bacteroides sp. TaxID=162156 RepID=UPI0025F59731|nr:glycoside hydrolase family 18 [uncultured Bacteroides sp.]